LPVASGSWGRESCLFSLKYRMAVVGIISTLGGCEDLGCCETKVCGVRAMCKLCIIRALWKRSNMKNLPKLVCCLQAMCKQAMYHKFSLVEE
jgi:hypothetical protein